ncbi:MAG: DUF4349 domain-containing protein [Lachnospiraceae bacterium]
MKATIRKSNKTGKLLLGLLFGFVAIFLLRWGYEVFFTNRDIVISHESYAENANMEGEDYSSRVVTKNIATDKINQKDNSGQDITIDQKYEKSANMSAVTSDFANDNENLRTIINENDAVIQSENLTGLQGRQMLTMKIGVMPENFDTVVEQIKTVGTLRGFTVNKEDKTAEFRSLLAEQQTLIKTRDAYQSMKEKGGSIQDLLMLEEKILEVEISLQNLGVNIDTYSTEHSFCTINFTLNESESIVQETSLRFIFRCARNSFFWTIGLYALLAVLTLGGLAFVVMFLTLALSLRKTIAKSRENEQEDPD